MTVWPPPELRWGLALAALGCAPHPGTSDEGGEPPPPRGWFQEVSRQVGVDFVHQDGRSGRRYYVETAASGGGWLDFDGDGDLDLYLVNGAATPGAHLPDPPRNALFENRGGRFVDVTEATGVGDRGYGMGLCAGDYDGDGQLDFFVTNYGADRLFHNGGHGPDGQLPFEESAQRSGVAGDRWGTNCAFADLDGDGDLDLYVVNYVAFSFDNNPRCGDDARGIGSYCRPAVFDGQPDYLYINHGSRNGRGATFVEEGERRGILQGSDEKGYGVVITDLNDDGAADIFVANDETPNRLYINDGRGYFEDRALASGVALNRDGHAESGMGLDVGDADGDGRADLMVTNYAFETNTLYLNRGGLSFEDRSAESGLGAPSYLRVGWGVGLFDLDNDGDLDAAVANGHLLDNVALFELTLGYPQPNSLFQNDGRGYFEDRSEQAGPAFGVAKVSRALAVGDWNNDGRLDLLITNTNDTVDLLENTLDTGHHWLGLELQGSTENPSAIGSRVVLYREGERLGFREVRSGGSFLAQGDLRLHFGLGERPGPVTAEIRWPDGRLQTERIGEVDAYKRVAYNPR